MSRNLSKRKKKVLLDDISKYEYIKNTLIDEIVNQEQVVKNNKKNKNISLLKGITKFAAPVVISSIVVYGASVIGHFGRPFAIDKEKSSKVYTLECSLEDGINTLEEYKIITRNTDIPSSKFTITTPWTKNDDYYERVVYNYEEKKLKDINLYNAIISNDFDYICDNYKYKSSNIERCNNINTNNELSISAKIYIVDSNDNIYVVETNKRNLIITLFELFVVFASSTLIILGIKDKILLDINKNIYEYEKSKDKYYKFIFKHELTDEKIEELKSKVKKYEK